MSIKMMRMSPEQEDILRRLKEASSPTATPEALEVLACDPSVRVRRATAAHASTPPRALEKLSRSRDTLTRFALAGNTSASPTALDLLTEDFVPAIRRSVAANKSASVYSLLSLVVDDDLTVVEAVVDNPVYQRFCSMFAESDEDTSSGNAVEIAAA